MEFQNDLEHFCEGSRVSPGNTVCLGRSKKGLVVLFGRERRICYINDRIPLGVRHYSLKKKKNLVVLVP